MSFTFKCSLPEVLKERVFVLPAPLLVLLAPVAHDQTHTATDF